MKILNRLFIIALTCFMTISCSDSSNPETSPQEPEHQTTQIDADIAGMLLNNGNKWLMDEHTRTILLDMKATVMQVDLNSASTDTLVALGNDLAQQLDSLIQGCTMVGAEHDQLHTFLTGYIPAIEELSATGCTASAETVKYYLSNYHNYFE